MEQRAYIDVPAKRVESLKHTPVRQKRASTDPYCLHVVVYGDWSKSAQISQELRLLRVSQNRCQTQSIQRVKLEASACLWKLTIVLLLAGLWRRPRVGVGCGIWRLIFWGVALDMTAQARVQERWPW